MVTKVLHVTGAMNLGGAEVMLMDVLRFKSEEIHMDFLVNYNLKNGKVEGDFDKEIISKGSRIAHIGAQWDLGLFKYLSEFKKQYLSFNSPEIVHIHMNAKSGVIAWAAARAGAKKIIVHSHANLKIRGHWFKVFLSKIELSFQKWLMAKYATDFWGCSKEANESLFYKRLLSDRQSKVINNAIDTSKFIHPNHQIVKSLRDSYNLGSSSMVIGNVGRIVRHKNIAFVLEILELAKELDKQLTFVFAGKVIDNEYMKEFWSIATEKEVTSNIIHLGARGDIENVMASFDAFVGPALQEGFGLVAVEAQAAGLPAILYKGYPSSVDMGIGSVIFLDNFSALKWLEEIEELVQRPKVSSETIKEAIASKGFDAKTNTQVIENGYREVNLE